MHLALKFVFEACVDIWSEKDFSKNLQAKQYQRSTYN